MTEQQADKIIELLEEIKEEFWQLQANTGNTNEHIERVFPMIEKALTLPKS